MEHVNPGSAGVPPAHTRSGRGGHSRGYLPHYDEPGLLQMVTFRLADSLPRSVLNELEPERRDREASRRRRAETALDVGHGGCWLKDAGIASIVESAILHFDLVRYRLLAWVIMPNHVHVLVEVRGGYPLSNVVHAWKSFTAKEANKLLGRTGRFWQPEYFDRAIRNERHLVAAVRYIEGNPVKASLVGSPEEWVFSSAGRTREGVAGETPALPTRSKS